MAKEVLDIVTTEDEVIATAERKECHEESLRHRGVHVFVFNSKGEVFMQKRSRKKDVFPGYHECSLTGHVLSGETYAQAAVREIKEELGISTTEERLDEMFKFKLLFGQEHEIITHFSLTCKNPVKLDTEEVESGEFMAVEEVKEQIKQNPKKFHPATVIAFERYELIDKIL